MKEDIGEDKYSELFYKKKKIHENAMLQALDIRKFEIELYWKRAAYFWTFIAATFAGYFVLSGSTKFDEQEVLLFFVNCLGLIFSFSWFLVNKGSKYWQENWEGHVDLLENIYMGPLYKTVIEKKEKSVFGASGYSVSKINIILSFFIFLMWIVLLIHTLIKVFLTVDLKMFLQGYMTYDRISIILLSFILVAFIIIIGWKGTSNLKSNSLEINLRKSSREDILKEIEEDKLYSEETDGQKKTRSDTEEI